jgi:hypothetical protein
MQRARGEEVLCAFDSTLLDLAVGHGVFARSLRLVTCGDITNAEGCIVVKAARLHAEARGHGHRAVDAEVCGEGPA